MVYVEKGKMDSTKAQGGPKGARTHGAKALANQKYRSPAKLMVQRHQLGTKALPIGAKAP